MGIGRVNSLKGKPTMLNQFEIQDNIPIEVYPGIFIGSMHASYNVEALNNCTIKRIVNLTRYNAPFPEKFDYLSLYIRDKETSNLLGILEQCVTFIENGIENGEAVFIHCCYGRSRSCAVIVGWLMMTQKLPFDTAFEMVRSKRPCVSMNDGFVRQLKLLSDVDTNLQECIGLYQTLEIETSADKAPMKRKLSNFMEPHGRGVLGKNTRLFEMDVPMCKSPIANKLERRFSSFSEDLAGPTHPLVAAPQCGCK